MSDNMALINAFSRKQLTENEVYIFNITLCDNEIDRDFEAFDEETLEQLGKLFLGKTGIRDHSMRSIDQSARIFSTFIEKTPGKKTSYGADYVALKASAYMVRTEKNEDMIKEIDGGIKKEVSVGCSVGKHICSICQKEKCNHQRGKTYDGKLCYFTLKDAMDAYEWSFVAVPAQREAGVTKSFSYLTQKNSDSLSDLLMKIIEKSQVSLEEKSALCDYSREILMKANYGELYRNNLTDNVKKTALSLMPELKEDTITDICNSLNLESLENLCTNLSRKKSKLYPPTVQLAHKNNVSPQNYNEYKI